MTRFSSDERDAEYRRLVPNVAHEISLCLKDEFPKVRVAALEALALIKYVDSAKHITPLLNDEVPLVRAKAAEALGIMDYKAAIPNLILLLSDKTAASTLDFTREYDFLPSPIVRVCDFAFHALMNFNDEIILLTLRHSFTQDDPLLKSYVCQAIDKVKDDMEREYFVDNFRTILFDRSPIIDNKLASELLNGIFDLLREQMNVETTEEVSEEFEETAKLFRWAAQMPVCCHAVESLAAIGTSKAIKLLLTALDNHDAFTQAHIIDKLGSWLKRFPDSSWHNSHKIIDIDPIVEKLRHDVVERLIPLLTDDAQVLIGDGEIIRICDMTVQSLYIANTDKAKLALEAWRKSQSDNFK